MNLWKNKLFFIGVLSACLFFNFMPVGHGFIAFSVESIKKMQLLITKIDKPQWKIAYSYHVNCKPDDRQNDEALTKTISDSLNVWLKPIRELRPERQVTDKFVYILQADRNNDQLEDLEVLRKDLRGVDLGVIFECKQGSSIASLSRELPPQVVLRRGIKVTPYMLFVLIHELGHAFGLADTYERPGVMRSRGGLPWTTGKQPWSIMSGRYYDDSLNLTEDDKRGIVWLYKHFYEGLADDDCLFADYVFVKEIPVPTCRPKHQLIFATKHSHTRVALELIKIESIDINEQNDDGMTALHYAVILEREEIVKALLADEKIKPFLRDKHKRSALQIARENKLDRMITLLLEHPLTLPVNPKGKLTTTWGHLKQRH